MREGQALPDGVWEPRRGGVEHSIRVRRMCWWRGRLAEAAARLPAGGVASISCEFRPLWHPDKAAERARDYR